MQCRAFGHKCQRRGKSRFRQFRHRGGAFHSQHGGRHAVAHRFCERPATKQSGDCRAGQRIACARYVDDILGLRRREDRPLARQLG